MSLHVGVDRNDHVENEAYWNPSSGDHAIRNGNAGTRIFRIDKFRRLGYCVVECELVWRVPHVDIVGIDAEAELIWNVKTSSSLLGWGKSAHLRTCHEGIIVRHGTIPAAVLVALDRYAGGRVRRR